MAERTLSHYKVFEELSRGGMGIVYRAVDIKLDREVALKVLPPELVADPERKRRFVQEAKAAAALHHPHIATIFEIDEADDTTFIAMELVRGQKLSELVHGEPLSLSRTLELATEIVDGLSCAHEKGIIHRDLKPPNIMLTEDGHPKIIDFGLAKLMEPLGSADSLEDTALRHTESGQILGTVSYMSPEQARGKSLDRRSDIFSFGIVLYEMVTGRLPFHGPSGVETLNAILKEPTPPLEIDGAAQERDVFAELERVIRRCLAKDPDERYQTTQDLLSELRRIRHDSDTGISSPLAPAASARPRPWRIAAAVAGVLVLAVAVSLYVTRSGDAGVPQLANPVQVTSAQGAELYPTWAPESSRLAYHSTVRGIGNADVWVTQLAGGQPVNRTADHEGNDWNPSWSSDGSQIAFASSRDGGGYFIMSALGGQARRVLTSWASLLGRPQWSTDGSRLMGGVRLEDGSRELQILTLSTRETERVRLQLRSGNAADLSWSPDERFVAYVDAVDTTAEVTRVWVMRLDDEAAFPITDGRSQDWSPSWSPDSRRVFFVSNRQGSMDLWQRHIDDDGSPRGEAARITTGVGMRSAAFSPDGSKLAYTLGRGIVSNLWRVPVMSERRATWSDAEQLTFDQAFIEFIDVSPDGQQLVLSSDRSGNQDLWTLSTSGGSGGGEMRQLTDDPAPDWRPSWSPDGNEIAFYSFRSGNRDIWLMGIDGSAPRQLTRNDEPDLHPFWSPDGAHIVFASTGFEGFHIYVVSREGGQPRLLADTPGDNLPAWSPDGRWIAYRSRRSGDLRIWRSPAEGGEAEQLTHGTSAGQPRFSPDGKELYFAAGGDRGSDIWSVSLEDGAERAVTDFHGRPGTIGGFGLATDGSSLYFTWDDNIGDLWVMDVVEN